jgi:hypothetical protein
MSVTGFTKLEALFRKVASIDIKKGHAKDIIDVIETKLVDLLIAAERNANMNGRDVIWESDLPITKGLQETMITLKDINNEIGIHDFLESVTSIPSLKYPLTLELEEKLHIVTGTLLVVMAKIIKEIDNNDRALDHETISRTKKIMDLTL